MSGLAISPQALAVWELVALIQAASASYSLEEVRSRRYPGEKVLMLREHGGDRGSRTFRVYENGQVVW